MKSYIEQLQENCKLYGEYIAFKSSARPRGITYSQLWEFSGKLYSYLKNNNYGKEDMILICLPRGIRSMVAAIGVIRTGAAFTIVESTYAKDRIEYIKKDCSCKLVIDERIYAEAMSYSFLEGYAEADPHDACFAVYTSGSTGNPKGVLHEYGKIEKCISSQIFKNESFLENATDGNPAPLNFVASLMLLFSCTYYKFCLYILPYDIVKDIEKLSSFIKDNDISTVFMPFSLFKVFSNIPSCLNRICLGSEPCNGVYIDKPMLTNSYAASETAFSIATFIIDKPYEVTPVGKNLAGIKIQIIDNNGNELPQGEIGEICVEDEYTRGYINLPEKTKEAFVDGMYHTGDLGYINENGDLVIKGRKDDMIKINGNRIEPAEIESKVKQVLGINNVIAKGFVSDRHSFVCAYLLASELESLSLLNDKGNLNINSEDINNKLSAYLPYYMIPTYYVVLDEYPKNANGKIARKQLAAPDIRIYKEEYVAPSNETEEYLCSLFSELFNIDSVSINDDFYLLGGDSITTVEFIGKCQLKGFTATDVYTYRTVKRLAEYYNENISNNDFDVEQKNIKALEHKQLLLPEMKEVLDTQEYAPESVMWNLPFLFKLKDDIDLDRFAKAINEVLRNHPVYATKIEYDAYQVAYQKYDPSLYEDIKIIDISEKQFQSIKDDLVKPYFMSEPPYYRAALYQTEQNKYFFIDHYHTISDGTSLGILFRQIGKCYEDENYVLANDNYYLMLREEEKKRINGEFEQISQYYKDFYKKYFVESDAKFAMDPDTKSSDLLGLTKYISNIDVRQSEVKAARADLTENEFFISALLLALAKYNHTKASYLQWIFNGRDSSDKINMTGLLFRALPVAGICENNKTLKEYYDEIVEEVRYSSSHDSIRAASVDNRFDESVYFLLQKNLVNNNDLNYAQETIELNVQVMAESNVEVYLYVQNDDTYNCQIAYANGLYKHESIAKLFEYFNEITSKLVKISDPSTVKVSSLI